MAVSQQPSAVTVSPQQDVGQPFKKIRLGEAKPDLQQPLRIDVRVMLLILTRVERVNNFRLSLRTMLLNFQIFFFFF